MGGPVALVLPGDVVDRVDSLLGELVHAKTLSDGRPVGGARAASPVRRPCAAAFTGTTAS